MSLCLKSDVWKPILWLTCIVILVEYVLWFCCLFQSLQDEVRSLDPQVDYVKDQADSLVTDAAPDVDTSAIIAETQAITDTYNKLNSKIDELLGEIEQGSEAVGDFQVGFHIIYLLCFQGNWDIAELVKVVKMTRKWVERHFNVV